jgi:hypothetical protein
MCNIKALDASALEEEGKLFPFLEGIAAYAQRHGFPMGLYFIGETLTELVSRTTDLENIQWKELDYPSTQRASCLSCRRVVTINLTRLPLNM